MLVPPTQHRLFNPCPCLERALCNSPRGVRRSGAYGVHKNKYCEEWNNLREDTHKTWTFNSFTTPRIIAAIPVASVIMYTLFKREQEMLDAKAAKSGSQDNLTWKPAKKLKYL